MRVLRELLTRNGSRPNPVLGHFFVFLLLLTLGRPASAGPLSERILLVAPTNGLSKIYVCRPDGKDLRRFSRVPGDQTQPRYSNKLQRIFYVRPHKGISQICSVDVEGRDFKVELAMESNTLNPDVSPDGQTLLFSTDLWGPYELAELDLKSREIRRLTYDQGINTYPRYSPDGQSILFLSRRNGASQVYLLERHNHALRALTESPFNKGKPSWNPAGTRIISTEAKPPRFHSVLFELDLATGKKRFLLPKIRKVSAPTYSADGSQVLFIEQERLLTFDPADTTALEFPLRGTLFPVDACWVTFPLP
jgi:Tol biopolymer transport system component